MNKVIAISRQHGSGGRIIGKLVAERLGIPFYDKEIIKQAAQKSGINSEHFTSADQSDMIHQTPAFVLSPGIPFESSFNDKMYMAQREAVLDIASREPCVIVGRGACGALKDKTSALCVFIYSDIENRKKRAIEEYHETPENIEKRIRKIDKKRMAYYNAHEKNESIWTENFNLCINSGIFGIEKTVDIICGAYESIK